MNPEDAIREALEQGLAAFAGRLNTDDTHTDVARLLAAYTSAAPTPEISVDFSADDARISARSLRGTVTVRYPSESEILAAWASAGLLVNPEALGLAQYEDSEGKRFWRWLGAP